MVEIDKSKFVGYGLWDFPFFKCTVYGIDLHRYLSTGYLDVFRAVSVQNFCFLRGVLIPRIC
jgi:hypothetical protein